jgi:hypothetical protein
MHRRALLRSGTAGLTTTVAAPAIAQGAVRWNMVMPWHREPGP